MIEKDAEDGRSLLAFLRCMAKKERADEDGDIIVNWKDMAEIGSRASDMFEAIYQSIDELDEGQQSIQFRFGEHTKDIVKLAKLANDQANEIKNMRCQLDKQDRMIQDLQRQAKNG